MPAGMAVWPSDLVCRWWTRRAFYLPRPRLPLLPLLGVERSTTWSHTAPVGATPEPVARCDASRSPLPQDDPACGGGGGGLGEVKLRATAHPAPQSCSGGGEGTTRRGPRKITVGTMVAGEHSTAEHSGAPWQAGPGLRLAGSPFNHAGQDFAQASVSCEHCGDWAIVVKEKYPQLLGLQRPSSEISSPGFGFRDSLPEEWIGSASSGFSKRSTQEQCTRTLACVVGSKADCLVGTGTVVRAQCRDGGAEVHAGLLVQ